MAGFIDMAVTPNYGWPVPVATDYVKDGYQSIADLGDAIDATVFGLGSGVIQVKSVTKTTAFSTSSSSFVDVTGLTVSITPTSASNQILVMAAVSGIGEDIPSGGLTGFQIVRDSTAIGINTDQLYPFTGILTPRLWGGSSASQLNVAVNYLDTPATTTATTYKIQARAAYGTLYINRNVDQVGVISTITVMEVSP